MILRVCGSPSSICSVISPRRYASTPPTASGLSSGEAPRVYVPGVKPAMRKIPIGALTCTECDSVNRGFPPARTAVVFATVRRRGTLVCCAKTATATRANEMRSPTYARILSRIPRSVRCFLLSGRLIIRVSLSDAGETGLSDGEWRRAPNIKPCVRISRESFSGVFPGRIPFARCIPAPPHAKCRKRTHRRGPPATPDWLPHNRASTSLGV